jgi:hypothetical protein
VSGSVAMSRRWTGLRDWKSDCKSGGIDGTDDEREAKRFGYADAGGNTGIGRVWSIIVDAIHSDISSSSSRLVVRPGRRRAGR